jgi:cell division protein ZapA
MSVKVLDKDYVVACPEEERENLKAAAEYLNQRMREMRAGGKVLGSERIAVITALNMAHELLQERREHASFSHEVDDTVQRVSARLDLALQGDKVR